MQAWRSVVRLSSNSSSFIYGDLLVRGRLSGAANSNENLRQSGRLRQEWRVAAFQSVGCCLTAEGAVDRRNHVILTRQRNRAIPGAADVMSRHRAKSSRRDCRRGYGAEVRFVAMKAATACANSARSNGRELSDVGAIACTPAPGRSSVKAAKPFDLSSGVTASTPNGCANRREPERTPLWMLTLPLLLRLILRSLRPV